MPKYLVACVVLAASAMGVAAQSTLPLSNDNRANITPQTHCKDKNGNVWLQSSAELAGSTDKSAGTTGSARSPESSPRPPGPVSSSGGPDMTEVVGRLPNCPSEVTCLAWREALGLGLGALHRWASLNRA